MAHGQHGDADTFITHVSSSTIRLFVTFSVIACSHAAVNVWMISQKTFYCTSYAYYIITTNLYHTFSETMKVRIIAYCYNAVIIFVIIHCGPVIIQARPPQCLVQCEVSAVWVDNRSSY